MNVISTTQPLPVINTPELTPPITPAPLLKFPCDTREEETPTTNMGSFASPAKLEGRPKIGIPLSLPQNKPLLKDHSPTLTNAKGEGTNLLIHQPNACLKSRPLKCKNQGQPYYTNNGVTSSFAICKVCFIYIYIYILVMYR